MSHVTFFRIQLKKVPEKMFAHIASQELPWFRAKTIYSDAG